MQHPDSCIAYHERFHYFALGSLPFLYYVIIEMSSIVEGQKLLVKRNSVMNNNRTTHNVRNMPLHVVEAGTMQ